MITDQIERLASLLERGLITRAEYDEQKNALFVQERNSSPPVNSVSDPETDLVGPGTGPSAPPATTQSPDGGLPAQVGAYNIERLLGTGGMASVYRGRHRSSEIATRHGGAVAVKVLHGHLARDAGFTSRFEREASLGLSLEHPGIVRVLDLVIDGGTLALVMELVEGRTLAQLVRAEGGPMPWLRVQPLYEQLLAAVEAAHAAGVIHRDLKPGNIMVSGSGHLKVLDFGIARATQGERATQTGTGMGTVAYMAPEQHTDARHVDARADVYALGMTLFELLAGRLPWGPELDAVGVLHRKLTGELPLVTDHAGSIPAFVASAVASAVSAEPDRRPPTVGALRQLLLPSAGPAPARPVPPPVVPPEELDGETWPETVDPAVPHEATEKGPTPAGSANSSEPVQGPRSTGGISARPWGSFADQIHTVVVVVAMIMASIRAGFAGFFRAEHAAGQADWMKSFTSFEVGILFALPWAMFVGSAVLVAPFVYRAVRRKVAGSATPVVWKFLEWSALGLGGLSSMAMTADFVHEVLHSLPRTHVSETGAMGISLGAGAMVGVIVAASPFLARHLRWPTEQVQNGDPGGGAVRPRAAILGVVHTGAVLLAMAGAFVGGGFVGDEFAGGLEGTVALAFMSPVLIGPSVAVAPFVYRTMARRVAAGGNKLGWLLLRGSSVAVAVAVSAVVTFFFVGVTVADSRVPVLIDDDWALPLAILAALLVGSAIGFSPLLPRFVGRK